MKKKKLFVFAHLLILGLIFLSSCKKKVTICSIFNETAYSVNDTIIADASCSENVEEYLWEPQEGLMMIGNGNTAMESFIVQPLSGILSRSINLNISNSKSSRSRTESVIVL